MIDRQDTGVARAVREALHHPVCAAMALALAAGAPVMVNAAGNITLSGGPLPYLGPTNVAPDLDYILIDAGATVNGNVTNAPHAAVTGAVTPSYGYAVTIFNSTVSGALINQGLFGSTNLSGAAVSVSNSKLTGGIQNRGTIEAQAEGIDVLNGASVTGGILNSGTIAAGATGIWVDTATLSDGLQNRGTIQAQHDGIDVVNGASVTGGILNSGTIAAGWTGIWLYHTTLSGGLQNRGTIQAQYDGINVMNGASVTGGILNSGTIAAGSTGIWLYHATLSGGLQNRGTIQAQHDGIDVVNGQSVTGGILNSGTIAAGWTGIWLYHATLSGGIQNRGTIQAQHDGIDVVNGPSVTGGILNSGTIAAGWTGIWVSNATLTGGILNSGTIAAGWTGIRLGNATLTGGIFNSGTIIGNAGDGITIYSEAFNGAITNSGLIDAPQGIGIRVGANLTGGIVNTGTIRGGVAAIDTQAATGPTVINLNGGAIDGNINLSPTFADTVNATAGTMRGNILATGPADDRVNFILNGGAFTFNGNIAGVNLVFVDPGTLYLNGNISGVNTVNVAANTNLVLGPTTTVNAVNFSQDATSTLTFTQAANGSHGIINGGNVNLAGNLVLPITSVNGLYAPNYALNYGTLMTWTTRSGTFNPLATGSMFLNGAINYGPTTLTAQVTRLPFNAVPPTLQGNAYAVATGLENAYPAAYTRMDADALTFYAPLLRYTAAGQYTQFLQAVSGSSYANTLQVSLRNAQLLNTAVDQRLGGAGGSLGVTNLDRDRSPTATGARALWATVLGNWGKGSGDSQAPGFNQSVGGIALGADYRLNARTLVGLLAGYQSGRITFDNRSSTDTTSWQLGAYGQYETNRWYGNGLVTFGWNGYDSQRNIFLSDTGALAKGHYEGTALVLYGEGGYQLPLGQAIIKPMLGLGYVKGDTGSFTESVGGVYRLHVQGAAGDSFTSNLGVRAELAYRTAGGTRITGEARAIWQHEFLADHQSIDASFATLPGSGFKVVGSRFAGDSAVLGLGVEAQVAAQTEISLNYEARLDSDYTANALFAAVRMQW